ncbi:MAG: hypothetical protein GY724_02950 [Actinomycetia bacterium]|nr:hypothetical protein [Actinomycetes bacterium]MCP5034100.1 hypothetical protein [Actinomycetes bacterium]
MRRYYLTRSVNRLLPEGEHALQVAYVWQRHRWMPLYALASFIALIGVAIGVDIEGWAARLVIGAAGAAVAASATSNYWVLVATTSGLVWFRGSRIRQRAAELVRRLPPSTDLERVGGSMLASEWSIDGHVYAASRSQDQELQLLAARRPE